MSSNPGKAKDDNPSSEVKDARVSGWDAKVGARTASVSSSENTTLPMLLPTDGAFNAAEMTSSRNENTIGSVKSGSLMTINPNDVLLGRGATIIGHEGNRRFHEIALSRKEEYINSRHHQTKDSIARQIMEDIHQHGGRFLRRIDSIVEAQTLGIPDDWTTGWLIASEEASIEKIKQALRDKNPNRKRGRSAAAKAVTNESSANNSTHHDYQQEQPQPQLQRQEQHQQPVASVLTASSDSTPTVAAAAAAAAYNFVYNAMASNGARIGDTAAVVYPRAPDTMLPGSLAGYPPSMIGYNNSLLPTATIPSSLPSQLNSAYLGVSAGLPSAPPPNHDMIGQQLQQLILQQGGQMEPSLYQQQQLQQQQLLALILQQSQQQQQPQPLAMDPLNGTMNAIDGVGTNRPNMAAVLYTNGEQDAGIPEQTRNDGPPSVRRARKKTTRRKNSGSNN